MGHINNTVSSTVYIDFCLKHAPRVLSSLDRNPSSPTFGCTDWRYWHDKAIDIPSGHDQEIVYFLALLYSTEYEGNLYYKNSVILKYIKACIHYWTTILHRSGYLDEFYPNEAQLGATAIVAWAMSETYQLINSLLSNDEKELFLDVLSRTGTWLCNNDENTNLANHQSQAMLALYNIYKITGNRVFHQGFLLRKKRVFKLFHEEGWFEEYDNFDPGYLTTNLSFMCRYWKYSNDEDVYPIMIKCLEMLQYCFLPDYQFGGVVGSRNTKHCWPSSFEILTNKSDIAKSLSAFYRYGLHKGYVFNPSCQDRYFVQQLYDYLWSYINAPIELRNVKLLPFSEGAFQKYFEESGVFAARNNSGQCMLINLRKGGSYHYCKIDKNNIIINQEINSGITLKLNNGEIVSTDYYGGSKKGTFKEINGGVKLIVHGPFYYSNHIVPNPFTFIAFRLFNLIFGQVSFIRKIFRHYLARILIMNRKKSLINFKREIEISVDKINTTDTVMVNDSIKETVDTLFFGGNLVNIFTPYSKGFEITDLFSEAETFNSVEESSMSYCKEL